MARKVRINSTSMRLALAVWTLVTTSSLAEDRVDFDRDIQPLIASKCLKCHGPDEPEGELNLTLRQSAIDAGAIELGNPEGSSLLERITSADPELRMPPSGPPIAADHVALFRRWIEQGADWPEHWAYRPLRMPAEPSVPATTEAWCRTPVDRFIAARLASTGLVPSAQADRLTLLRRLSFDLRGLPPTPEEVTAFLEDNSPDAWERLVDRLLASPAYGERWARHWMDLVHYAETHGHDQDRPRENAWPYRDYLIHSFNTDKPYATFVSEQIAGDVLGQQDPQAIVATGFLAAGPWDESSLRDIREDSIDREIGRYLDRDDIVTTVMSTFASTSVHCARCHDHKFDPITQRDYYGLQSVFAGIDKANRPYDPDPVLAARRELLAAEQKQLEAAIATNPESLLSDAHRQQLALWEVQQQGQQVLWEPLSEANARSLGGASLKRIDDGSYLVEGGRPEKDVYVVEATVSGPLTAIRLDVIPHETLPVNGPGRAENGNLHLSEWHVSQILDAEAGTQRELSFDTPLADFNQEGWRIEMALDGNPNTAWGIHPQEGKAHYAIFPLKSPLPDGLIKLRIELHQIHGGAHLIGRFSLATTAARSELLSHADSIQFDIAAILQTSHDARSVAQQQQLMNWFLRKKSESDIAALPAQQFVYCGTSQFLPEGSFRPTVTPRPIHVLQRGLVQQPREEATPQALTCLPELPASLSIADFSNEGQRRIALAQWLTDDRNALLWRSIANRIWQSHFGRGLVTTPNDFGQMGSPPSHPELLDWLAVALRDGGGSLKDLHRVIVCSAVYMQVSQSRPDAAAIDADNRLLWRMNRQRLDAESFRDAWLVVAGNLNSSMGGPSVRQFIQSPGVHVTPVVDYQSFSANDPANLRRSVYRFIFRTIPDPFMDALDCPDASQLTPTRNESLTALQTLATLNDKFVVHQAEQMALSLQGQSSDLSIQIKTAYQRLFGRHPREEELSLVTEYAQVHGLANTCRFLINTNEFLFVE